MKRDEAPTAERPFQRDMSAPSEKRTFEVGRPDHGTRLDLFLRAQLPWATRERLRGAIRAGRVAIEPWKDPQGADAGARQLEMDMSEDWQKRIGGRLEHWCA